MATRLGIHLGAARHVIERGGARNLVIVAAVDAAHAQTFALAGPVHGERMEAPAGEFEPGEKDAHLLGVVHAIDDHHGRGRALNRRLHEQCRQRGARIRHLDELDVGMAQPDAGVVAAIGLASPFALLLARQDEALGIVVVIAGAQVTVAGGVLAAGRGGSVGRPLHLRAERAPFLLPRLRLVLAQPQPLAGAIHLLQRHHAIGGHALDDEGGVRPQEIVAEVVDPGTSGGHGASFR